MREPAVCHSGTQVLNASLDVYWLRFGSFSTDRQTVPSHCIHDGALFASWGGFASLTSAMPLLKSVEPATSVPEGCKVLGGPDPEANVVLTFAVKLQNLFILIADSVIIEKVIRDEGRTTLFSLLSGVLAYG